MKKVLLVKNRNKKNEVKKFDQYVGKYCESVYESLSFVAKL